MNPLLRQEGNFALIAALINNAAGGKAKPADFMPWAKDEVAEEAASMGDVMTMLSGGPK